MALKGKELNKKLIDLILILVLVLGLVVVSGYAIYMENQHNKCVVKYNDCSENCQSRSQLVIGDQVMNDEFEDIRETSKALNS